MLINDLSPCHKYTFFYRFLRLFLTPFVIPSVYGSALPAYVCVCLPVFLSLDHCVLYDTTLHSVLLLVVLSSSRLSSLSVR